MSHENCGIKKDLSAVMTCGRASKCAIDCVTKGILDCFDDENECCTEITQKLPFNQEVKFTGKQICSRTSSGYDFSSSWKMGMTKQAAGMTMHSDYSSCNKQWNSYLDWGQIYPNLSLFSAMKYSGKDFK